MKFSLTLAFLLGLASCSSSLFSSHTVANKNIICSAKISEEHLIQILNQVKVEKFSDLEKINLQLDVLDQDNYFFEIKPDALSLFFEKRDRKYTLSLNPKVLNCPLPEDSLKAILMHELIHLEDYEQWSTWQILGHAYKFLVSDRYRIKFERDTDIKALEKGAGLALIGHRKWVYQWLDPDELKLKMKIYLTPLEIENWVKEHQ